MKAIHLRQWISLGALTAAAGACGGGSTGGIAGTMGMLRVAVTDAPACGYDAVTTQPVNAIAVVPAVTFTFP